LARLSDFIAAYQPEGALPKYVGMQTPNREYYVGLFKEDALHPQTLLCYEMNGQPLSRDHGAPLRLVTPLKYGIKHLKQIGKISFTDQRPTDYWAENGYDWNAGH
jgi:DMSO/TMAO reductase YedYZ molybdopterin-dependent catalytic subunit